MIKAVANNRLGLKEAKDVVHAAPKAIKEGITKEEAASIKAKLAEAGAKSDVKQLIADLSRPIPARGWERGATNTHPRWLRYVARPSGTTIF